MNYFVSYDRYLRRLADADGNLVSLGRVHLVCLPWFVAIILVRPAFALAGWGGAAGTLAGTALSVALLAGLLWSGARYLVHRARRRNADRQGAAISNAGDRP